jgi:hypothetical protein
MDIFNAIFDCIFGSNQDSIFLTTSSSRDDMATATEIVKTIYNTEKNGEELKARLTNTIYAYSWTENLAKAVLNALDTAVREGRAMSPALKEAYDKACQAADAVGGFVKEHPIFCTVIVLGILALLMPWVIEALGFAAEGPVAGKSDYAHKPRCLTDYVLDSFAALWQSRYAGYVPKGSLFSFFQRLGMTWVQAGVPKL